MTLYEITEEMQQLDECYDLGIDPETGEFNPNADFNAKLEELGQNLEDKLESIYKFLRNTEAEATALKAEADRLAKLKKQKENKIAFYKQYILRCMMATGDKKWVTPLGSFNTRKSQTVELCEGLLDINNGKLWRIKQEPNKEAIKAMLKAGETVTGAILTENTTLQIK